MIASGYPARFDDPVAELVDIYRCVDVYGGRRCQLFTGHDGPHAAGWVEPRPFTPGAAHRLGPAHWSRWDAHRRWEQQPGTERLRWCCLYRG